MPSSHVLTTKKVYNTKRTVESFVDTPTNLEGSILKENRVKISTNINKIIYHSLYGKPLLIQWCYINTLQPKYYKQIDWTSLKVEDISDLSNRHRWAVILASKELPKSYVM